MRPSPQKPAIYVLSVLFAVAPFAFASIRLLETRSDLRLLWMAIASLLGTSAVLTIAKKSAQKPAVLFAVTFVIATLCAGATAFMLGATVAPGVWILASVFGLCWAAYSALRSVSLRGRSESLAAGEQD